jgi:hypothetical protein
MVVSEIDLSGPPNGDAAGLIVIYLEQVRVCFICQYRSAAAAKA